MVQPLIYFSYGMTKSGSTLAFELARTALEYCGYPQDVLPAEALGTKRRINFAQHIDDEQAEALLLAVNKCGYPVVVKTHTRPDPAVVTMIQSGKAKAHAIYRDPRDLALSMLDHAARSRDAGRPSFAEIETLDDAVQNIRHQTDTLTAWLRLPGVIPLYFEDVAFDTAYVVEQVLDQLGLSADAAFIADHVKTKRFTQKNLGAQLRYPDEMPERDSTLIAEEFAPMIKYFINNRKQLPNDNIALPAPQHLRTSAAD